MIKLSTPIAGCMRWGKWGAHFSLSDYRFLIDQCLANEITAFDHADIYGDYTTEAEFGEAIKSASSLRRQMQLITKCGIQLPCEARPQYSIKSYNTSKAHIIASVEQSLRNFHTDYIDVLLIHRPDPLMQPSEIAAAVTQLLQQGKIKAFGVSNFQPAQIKLLQQYVAIQYNQLEISLLKPAAFVNGMLDYCLAENITPMAWAPLGGGILNDESHPRSRDIIATANELSEKYLTGINQLLLAWIMQHPSGIIPVLGSTRLERLMQAKYAASIQLEREDWFRLYTASIGTDIP